MKKNLHQSMKSKTRWVTTNNYFRQAGSTGARVSQRGFSPSSPRGGVYGSAYESARSVASYYGYDPEAYIRRQVGPKYHHRNWDFYKRYILQRKHYNHNATFPFLPRFPKRRFTKTFGKNIQKGSKFRGSEFYSRATLRDSYRGKRQCSSWPNKCHRCNCANWRKMPVFSRSNAYY